MYDKCMRYKCKTCPKKIECDKKLEIEHLTWRPFEELPKILKEKGNILTDSRISAGESFEKAVAGELVFLEMPDSVHFRETWLLNHQV